MSSSKIESLLSCPRYISSSSVWNSQLLFFYFVAVIVAIISFPLSFGITAVVINYSLEINFRHCLLWDCHCCHLPVVLLLSVMW